MRRATVNIEVSSGISRMDVIGFCSWGVLVLGPPRKSLVVVHVVWDLVKMTCAQEPKMTASLLI